MWVAIYGGLIAGAAVLIGRCETSPLLVPGFLDIAAPGARLFYTGRWETCQPGPHGVSHLNYVPEFIPADADDVWLSCRPFAKAFLELVGFIIILGLHGALK